MSLRCCVQDYKLNENNGNTDPAATAALSWTDQNGTTYSIFEHNWGENIYNVTPLPYTAEIPVGSQIILVMDDDKDNYDRYRDGGWAINISENGISFDAFEFTDGRYNNTFFVLQNLNRSSTWEIPMPCKFHTSSMWYKGIIPFNGSNATLYNIDGRTPYRGQNFSHASPENFFKSSSNPGGSTSVRVPIPLGAVIMAIGIMLFISYKRVE